MNVNKKFTLIIFCLIISIKSYSKEIIYIDTIEVQGSCLHCKERIENAAKTVDGIKFAKWNSKTKLLIIKSTNNNSIADKVENAISKVGHDTKHYSANFEVYQSLPACCKYRNEK